MPATALTQLACGLRDEWRALHWRDARVRDAARPVLSVLLAVGAAHALGLVHILVEDQPALAQESERLVQQVFSCAPGAVAAAKDLIRAVAGKPIDSSLIADTARRIAERHLELLAPTGRAAKVITNYSDRKAFTIHKRIYRKKSAMNFDSAFQLAENLATDTLFIVD